MTNLPEPRKAVLEIELFPLQQLSAEIEEPSLLELRLPHVPTLSAEITDTPTLSAQILDVGVLEVTVGDVIVYPDGMPIPVIISDPNEMDLILAVETHDATQVVIVDPEQVDAIASVATESIQTIEGEGDEIGTDLALDIAQKDEIAFSGFDYIGIDGRPEVDTFPGVVAEPEEIALIGGGESGEASSHDSQILPQLVRDTPDETDGELELSQKDEQALPKHEAYAGGDTQGEAQVTVWPRWFYIENGDTLVILQAFRYNVDGNTLEFG